MDFDAAETLPAPDTAPSPETAPAAPRGDALWEMALEGMDWAQAPKPSPVPVPEKDNRVRAWIGGGLGLLFVGAAAVWFATARVTTAPSAVPQAPTATGQVGPAPASAGDTPVGSVCSVQPVTPDPPAGGTTDVMVTGVPAGAPISLAVSYAGGTARSSVPSDGSGVSYATVNLATAPAGTPVQVLVTAGNTSCHTSFTPAANGSPTS